MKCKQCDSLPGKLMQLGAVVGAYYTDHNRLSKADRYELDTGQFFGSSNIFNLVGLKAQKGILRDGAPINGCTAIRIGETGPQFSLVKDKHLGDLGKYSRLAGAIYEGYQTALIEAAYNIESKANKNLASGAISESQYSQEKEIANAHRNLARELTPVRRRCNIKGPANYLAKRLWVPFKFVGHGIVKGAAYLAPAVGRLVQVGTTVLGAAVGAVAAGVPVAVVGALVGGGIGGIGALPFGAAPFGAVVGGVGTGTVLGGAATVAGAVAGGNFGWGLGKEIYNNFEDFKKWALNRERDTLAPLGQRIKSSSWMACHIFKQPDSDSSDNSTTFEAEDNNRGVQPVLRQGHLLSGGDPNFSIGHQRGIRETHF